LIHDVVIAGGGPAGLAAAIRSAQRGFGTLVLERSDGVPDKACGEGLMPAGVRELRKLGALPEESAPFRGIRYLQEDGSVAEARFGEGDSGLGIRRLALAQALRARAVECGAEVQRGSVKAARAQPDRIAIETDGGAVEARLLVAADGLHSPLRHAAGLDGPAAASARFGIRRHFALAPWTDFVEVYWSAGVEAYVTPVAANCVNVALLCEGGGQFDDLLARFPKLHERLHGAPAASEARGAGPLLQRARARHAQRLALVGDAAGYVDAITGQGLSLAFAAAALLFAALPQDLAQDLAPALHRYDRDVGTKWLRYSLPAHALVTLSRRPALRRAAIRSVAALPGAFASLVRVVSS
jgi:menaquinone-9 beta-reductase